MLAFVTTIHAAMVVLRKYRSAPTGVVHLSILPSLAFAAGPWVFPAPAQLVIGLLAHVAWFVACDQLLPQSAPRKTTARPATSPSVRRPIAASAVMKSATPAPGAQKATASKDFTPVPVLAVHDETESIRTYRLARPDGFGFEAGQFATVRVQVDGHANVRCYSISSAPEATGYLEISVRRQGLVSGMLYSMIRPGSTLMLKSPAGKFVYPAGDDRPVVLLAGGVGITPLMSMLRHAVMADPARPVTLLYSVRDEHDIAFREELSLLTRRHPHVRVAITVSGRAQSGLFRSGRIDDCLIREMVPMPGLSIFLICGPVQMIEATEHLLERLEVPSSQIRSEVFLAPVAIGAKPSPAAHAARPQPDPGDEAAETIAAGTSHLTLVRTDRTVEIEPSQTLLEAAEGAGAAIPCMCRAGVCGACRTKVVEGETECTSDALDEDDRANGYVLPCVTWAKSDCAIEA
jgi:ferredoxin-NADP reductase